MSEVFGELDARLSVITRWVVINTIKKQSVAEHCFNVERIARRIAEAWFEITNVNELDIVSQIALHHDDDEAITGDIPSPSKHILSEAYLDSRRDMWYNIPCQQHDIVKLADKMEAYYFLTMEYKLGNSYIDEYRDELATKVRNVAYYDFGKGRVLGLVNAWIDDVNEIQGKTHGWTT